MSCSLYTAVLHTSKSFFYLFYYIKIFNCVELPLNIDRFSYFFSLGKNDLTSLVKHNLALLGKLNLALFSLGAKGPKDFKYLLRFDRKLYLSI